MQIHSIQIKNFWGISGTMALFPSCHEGEKLTLLQGEDEHAVNRLYDACRWCLIGEDAFDEVTAAGPLFNDSFYKYMIVGEVGSIQANMIFSHEGETYLLRRRREYRCIETNAIEDLKPRSTVTIFCRSNATTWQALPPGAMSRLEKEIAAARLCLPLRASSCHEVLSSLGSEQHLIFVAKSELVKMMNAEDIWRIEQCIGTTYQLHRSPDGVRVTCVQEVHTTAQDVLQAMEELPRFSLPGRPALENFFNDRVIDVLRSRTKYRYMGSEFPGAILLHGPLGSGKTYAVETLGAFLGWSRHYIDGLVMNDCNGRSPAAKIKEIFDAADNGPSIIVIDDMDALFSRHFQRQESRHYTEMMLELLRCIASAAKNFILVIGIADRLDNIDPTFLRRDRFGQVVEVKMPTQEEVAAALDALLSVLPVGEDVETSSLSTALAGRPLSDLSFVVKEAGRLSAKKGLENIDKTSLWEALHSLSSAEKTI